LSLPQPKSKGSSPAHSDLFSIRPPRAEQIPVVVEIPHAGLSIDPLSAATLAAPVTSIGRDADLYVDDLYIDAADLGATVLVSHVSRYVCDLNRSETDIDGVAVLSAQGSHMPHGLIWHQTTEAQPALSAPLPPAELERRLRTLYRPYHATLRRLLNEHRERFGFVILLAAHSMPSAGRSGHVDPGSNRADVVPGSRGFSTAAASVVRCPETLARARGWAVQHDAPYRGGFTTGHYGQPNLGFHAVQVELNRRLYMDEMVLNKRHPGFVETRSYCRDLVAALGQIDPR
jgi:N-formylglutamate deformylase